MVKLKFTDKAKDFIHLADEEWHIQGINAVPAFVYACQISGIFHMKDSLGYNYSRIIIDFKEDYSEVYYHRKDAHHVCDNFLQRYRKKNKYTNWLMKKSKQDEKPFLKLLKKVNAKMLKNLQTKDLLKEYQNLCYTFYKAFGTSHLIEGFALTTDVRVKDMLLKELQKLGKEKEYTRYFSDMFLPTRKSFNMGINNSLNVTLGLINNDKELVRAFKEDIDVIRNKIRNNKKLVSLLNKFVKDFYWSKCTWANGRELIFDDLIKEIKEYIAKGDKFNYISDLELRNNAKKIAKLKDELKLSEELRMYLHLTEFFTYWQDDRKVIILKGVWALEKYVQEISKRTDIKVENLKYLLPYEIEDIGSITDKELAERRKASIYANENNKAGILVGKEYELLHSQLKKHIEENIKEIGGLCASTGKVIGRVNVCINEKDIPNVKPGDILVTTMTRPEFLPAMKKSLAVVTDEGGLTCHAAIVSRELKIPCVIGTKKATKVLKTGMLVEVNANHGLVKILK